MCKCCETIEFWKESEKDKNSKIFAKIAVYSWKEGNRRMEGEEYFNYTTRAYDLKYCPSCRKEAGRVKTILGKYVETLDNHKGIVVKQYKPTGKNIDSIHIQQENGRIWYCPISNLIYVEEDKQ